MIFSIGVGYNTAILLSAILEYFFQRLVRQSYYAATSYMDTQVGEVLNTLDQIGWANDTIVVLVGDHGMFYNA